MAESLAWRQPARAPAMLRATALALAVLVALAALLWLLPALLDWSSYRGAIASFASRQLGRPVRIDGPITVTLLPTPLVTAGSVRLGDPGDGIALAAPALQLRLAFAPLLLGRVMPRALVLSGAAIDLPWPLPHGALASGRPDWLASSFARIEHGTLTIGALKLNDLNAELAPGADVGGLAVSGSARSFGQTWRFSDRLGAPDALGDTPVEATLQAAPPPNQPQTDAGARFVGTLAHDGAIRGRVSAFAADLSRLLPAPPIAARVSGTVGLGGQGPARTELNLTVGTVPIVVRLRAAPAVSGHVGEHVLSLTTGRIDLDAWVAALARLRAGQNAAGMIALPWPVALDLAADAVTLHGGLIRNLRAALEVDGHRGLLREANAVLPGEAALSLHGTLIEDVFGLTLTGRARLEAPQLRTTLDWLRDCGLRLGAGLPPGVLRTAHLAGAVAARRDAVQITGLTGTLEASSIAGSLGVETGSGALTADLTLDTLPADDWIPPGTPARWSAIGPGLAGMDVALKLRARSTDFRGHRIAALSLDASSSAGGVMINRLEASLDGLHGRLAGTIAADGGISEGQFDLDAPHATGMAAWLPQGLQFADYFWAGPVRLHAEAAGPSSGLVTSVSLDIDDARLEAHSLISLDSGAWSARLTLRHPGAPRLLDALGLPRARNWVGEGSLSLLAQASGVGAALKLDSFDLTAGKLHATGDGRWTPSGAAAAAAPSLTAHVAADTLPLPAFAPRETTTVPLGWLSGWSAVVDLTAQEVSAGDTVLLRDAAATVRLANNVLSLEGLRGAIGGGAVAGVVRLDTAAVPPKLIVQASVQGAVVDGGVFGLPIDIASGTLAGRVDLAATGYSPAAMAASLAGAATLSGNGGTLAGLDLAAARSAPDRTAFNAALTTGTTRFDQVIATAAVANGTSTLTRLDLYGPDGSGTGDGTIDLADGLLNLRLLVPALAELRLSGKLSAPHRTIAPLP